MSTRHSHAPHTPVSYAGVFMTLVMIAIVAFIAARYGHAIIDAMRTAYTSNP